MELWLTSGVSLYGCLVFPEIFWSLKTQLQPIQQCLVLCNGRVAVMLLMKQLQVERLLAAYTLMLKLALFRSWLPLACTALRGQLFHTHCILWAKWVWLCEHSGLAPSVFRTETRGREKWRERRRAGKGSRLGKHGGRRQSKTIQSLTWKNKSGHSSSTKRLFDATQKQYDIFQTYRMFV